MVHASAFETPRLFGFVSHLLAPTGAGLLIGADWRLPLLTLAFEVARLLALSRQMGLLAMTGQSVIDKTQQMTDCSDETAATKSPDYSMTDWSVNKDLVIFSCRDLLWSCRDLLWSRSYPHMN
jgi:hypothetical protein